MPLIVPILRMFMLFLNVWDTFKTLKPPPYKIRNGKAEPPTVRSVTQRKRDLKGCLAVWIVWCCFSTYERLVEPIISLFIPFYNELKSLVILFLIFTRARGAEPIFLHLLRPMLRPYTKSIDSSLELFRLIGDLLFAIISFPLRPVAALLPSYFGSRSPGDDIPPPYSEGPAAGDQYTPPSDFQQSSVQVSSFHPADPAADMEWRQYPNLPSAYPPTPLVTSSRLPVQGHVGYDASSAAGPHTIWIPPVVDEDEEDDGENQQGFRRSLLPPRVPLHPGLGNYDGLSDESDRGAENHQIIADFQSNGRPSGETSSAEETDDMEMDDDERNHRHSSDGDAGTDSEEDSFNMTLQTPRVPLSLQPSSATMSRSTIRLRASARSVFADLERETEGRRHLSGSVLLPPLDTTSRLGQGSSPSSIDSGSLSISSGDDSAFMSLPNPHSVVPSLIPISGNKNDDNMSDSSLGSAPGAGPVTTTMRSISPTGRGRKRSHSRSFPPEHSQRYTRSNASKFAGSTLQRLSSTESSSSSRAPSPSNDADVHEAVADTTLKDIRVFVDVEPISSSSASPVETQLGDVKSNNPTGENADEVRPAEGSVAGPRKRRKVVSLSSGPGHGSPPTSESEPTSRSHTGLIPKPSDAFLSDRRKKGFLSTRTRRQLSGASTSASEGTDGPSSSDNVRSTRPTSNSKGKGRSVAPSSTRVSSVPTRRHFDVSHKLAGASTSIRMTRSTVGLAPTAGTGTEASNETLNVLGIGLGANDHPLRFARARAKKRV
ncbi:hypothetical protein C8R41DRAFT_903772 [Lentinula lateritia]|uniref:Protein YOP1 n=1 Tax=Lentinula lateritia TaxID=40482 RepID=A0ABQ8VBM7_9AGAR|nr:hypothetical protein C8R41DRAFT_903772 [Lentinula lateritia]